MVETPESTTTPASLAGSAHAEKNKAPLASVLTDEFHREHA